MGGQAWAQGTEQFRLEPDASSAAIFPGIGSILLTGHHLVVDVETRAGDRSHLTIQGPAGVGTNGPVIIDFGFYWGAADDHWETFDGEFDLTDEQVSQLRAGLWYMLVNDTRRAQILYSGTCGFTEVKAIQFESLIEGWIPPEGHGWIRWGRATCGLTGNTFTYDLTMPSAFMPLLAFIAVPTATHNHRDRHVFDLGTLNCVPLENTNPPPDAAGLEFLPRCRARGALCLSDEQVAALLGGLWNFRISAGNWPISGGFFPVDSDHDGVPDYLDQCAATVTNSLVNTNGCSLEDLCPCDGPWKNHGDYLKCLKDTTRDFQRAGLITEKERKALMKQGERSDCGKKKPHHP